VLRIVPVLGLCSPPPEMAAKPKPAALEPRPEGNQGLRGGAAYVAQAIRRAQQECGDRCVTLLIDGGDMFQGTAASNLAFGRPVVQFHNALGFAAGALGNHEFDWGQDSLRARKNLAAEGALRKSGIETAQSSRDLIKDKETNKRLERAQRLQLTPEEIESELDAIEARLAKAQDDADSMLRAAELYEMKRDLRGALDQLERAKAVRPTDASVAGRLADVRIKLQDQLVQQAEARGDAAAAANARRVLSEMRVAEYRRRVAANPTDLGFRFELGEALFQVGDADGAIAELQQAAKDPRKAVDALLTLGRAFRGKSLTDLARAQYEKALATTGGAGGRLGKEILYELGGLAEAGGDRDAAKKHYSAILELDWSYKDAADRVARLQAS